MHQMQLTTGGVNLESEICYSEGDKTRILRGSISSKTDTDIVVTRNDGIYTIPRARIVYIKDHLPNPGGD